MFLRTKDLLITLLRNAGIRDIKNQSIVLNTILDKKEVKNHKDLVVAINKAIISTDELALWLEEKASSKKGPSGIGKENYTWYLQNVHLVPLTWSDEVMILKRELARAWSALKLEEHQNRNLSELVAADTPEAYDKMAQESANG